MKSLSPGCVQFNLHYFKTKTLLLVFFLSFSFISSYSQAHLFEHAGLASRNTGPDTAACRLTESAANTEIINVNYLQLALEAISGGEAAVQPIKK